MSHVMHDELPSVLFGVCISLSLYTEMVPTHWKLALLLQSRAPGESHSHTTSSVQCSGGLGGLV